MNLHPKTAFLLLLTCLLPGCWPHDDSAHFTLSGKASLDPACFSSAFPLDATFITAREHTQTLSLFFQSAPGNFHQADLIYFEVYQPKQIRTRLGQKIPLSPPATPNPIIGGKVGLLASCPDLLHSFYLDGDVVFSALEHGKNAQITGSITDARILNARSHEPVAEGLSGTWNFSIRQGQPYQEFYALPEK